jgi:hypothetical protein
MGGLSAWAQWVAVVVIGLSPILTVFGVCIVGRRFVRRPPQSGSLAASDQFQKIPPRGGVIDRQVDPAFSGSDLGRWQ